MCFCQACGRQNREQARFCGHCGCPLQTDAEAPIVETNQLVNQDRSHAQGREREPTNRASFHGTAGSIFGIYTINIFWTILTLGIYRFWGKVKVQRYLASQTEFEGDRFAYHGRGEELLIGFLKVLVVFGIPYVLLNIVQDLQSVAAIIHIVATILSISLSFVFVAVATVGARRYRLSRISWRGIRFSFRGRALEFLKLLSKGSLLTFLTFGLYFPTFVITRHRFLISHSYFGNQKFDFDGRGQDLLGSYILALLLSGLTVPFFFGLSQLSSSSLALLLVLPIPGFFWRDLFSGLIPLLPLSLVSLLLFFLLSSLHSVILTFLLVLPILGVCWFRFFTKMQRYVWDHTSFTTARFHSTLPVAPRLLLKLENLGFLIVTFGLGWPWVVVRNAQFAFSHLTLDGPVELNRVQQEAPPVTIAEAGFFDFFDTGFDLG
jgi:uncharacterized membrane protein YjgN (DUF898 family)